MNGEEYVHAVLVSLSQAMEVRTSLDLNQLQLFRSKGFEDAICMFNGFLEIKYLV